MLRYLLLYLFDNTSTAIVEYINCKPEAELL